MRSAGQVAQTDRRAPLPASTSPLEGNTKSPAGDEFLSRTTRDKLARVNGAPWDRRILENLGSDAGMILSRD